MNNSVSFGSTSLYKVNVLKNDKPVKAVFSELSPSDVIDRKAVEYINKNWGFQELKKKFVNKFKADEKYLETRNVYFAIEIPSLFKPLGNKIIAIAQVYLSSPEALILDIVQVKNPHNSLNKVFSGVGKAVLLGASKFTKESNKKILMLEDGNPKFYDAIKIPKDTELNGWRKLEGFQLDEFMERVKI